MSTETSDYDPRPPAAKATDRVAFGLERLADAAQELRMADERVAVAQHERAEALDRGRKVMAESREAWEALGNVLTEAASSLAAYLDFDVDTETMPDDVEADYAAQGDGADAASFEQRPNPFRGGR